MTEEVDKDRERFVTYGELKDVRDRVNDLEASLIKLQQSADDNSSKLDEISDKIDNLPTNERISEIESNVSDNREDIEPVTSAIQSALSVADLIRWLIASGFITLVIFVLQLVGILPSV